jgi:hypothetical protein
MIMQNCTKEQTIWFVCMHLLGQVEVEAKSPRFESQVEIFVQYCAMCVESNQMLIEENCKCF